MKCYYPEVFAAALLNSQPMGFYAPAQLVRDASEHGVEVRPPDVNASDWDCTLETPARTIAAPCALASARSPASRKTTSSAWSSAAPTPYRDPADLWRRGGLNKRQILALARADAFASLGLSRRDVLWAVRGFSEAPLPLLDGPAELRDLEPAVACPTLTLGEQVVDDYALDLDVAARPSAGAAAADASPSGGVALDRSC